MIWHIEIVWVQAPTLPCYIISSGLVLKDGETIGFSAEQKWQISHSKSVYAPSEFSLKIDIQ
ncbi:DUF4261 domain-containing protein [Alysiella filiformis]|uniref:DUF4261 domain-containing protein n=1 Tax=Alysiella filiformis TaxID=194196 RepID=UPI000BE40CA9|nr:DUF4261 domain-containing protein [Alysiella filiformis]QMT31978.1 DUF4261 domain-containing protein [Alysiella filiformis]UBQ57114.1 DUF4261 domain-containing protein [Alysiella filiformis DSM 16848]